MNNERLNALLTYLDALTKLHSNDYHCISEINECIDMVKTEFAKKPSNIDVFADVNDIRYGRADSE